MNGDGEKRDPLSPGDAAATGESTTKSAIVPKGDIASPATSNRDDAAPAGESAGASAVSPLQATAATVGPGAARSASGQPISPLSDAQAPLGLSASVTAVQAAPAIVIPPSDADVERQLSRLSRRGFLTLAAGATGAVLGWRWLISQPRAYGVALPFRRVLQANEALWEALWDPTRLAPTYPHSRAAKNPRVNGKLGLDQKADPAAWSLKVEGAAAGPLTLSLADVQALPAQELVTELRCVEGWMIVVHWTGARLSDFMARFPPAARDGSAADPRQPQRMPPFLALETPGRGYYVGLDLQSALHPQTLLAWAINGQPLTWDHGAPLRLVAPMKYSVKSLKRIGTLRYSFVRPTDYWFERGYDWYLGH